MDKPADPPTAAIDPFLEHYLDRLQNDHPSVAGDDARLALKKIYKETCTAQRCATAGDIYRHINNLLHDDLKILQTNGLGLNLTEMFLKDPAETMKLFLGHTYNIILKNIAAAGGVEVINPKALSPNPNAIEVTTELTDEDRIMLKHPSRGQA